MDLITPAKSRILLVLIIGLFLAVDSFASPDETLLNYLKAIKNREWQKAEAFWLSEDVERSKHLGIEFTDIKAKYDCTSPPVYLENQGIDSLCRISHRIIETGSSTAIAFADIICPNDDSVSLPYYLKKVTDEWRLCSPMSYYASEWQSLKTRYYIIYYTDQSLMNNYALAQLDSFTDSLAVLLEISAARIKQLERKKIHYYLCSEQEIKLLTGYDAHGMTSLPFDAIITRHLPHPHEITHLMINYALQKAPLYTLPVLQEGLACCLGGRWGKAPAVINYWGASIANLGLVDLDSVLTADGFNNCPAGLDGAYAVSSLFSSALIKNYGMDRYLDFCKKMSGNNIYVNSSPGIEIIGQAEAAFMDTWENIKTRYKQAVINNSSGGIIPESMKSYESSTQIYESGESSLRIWAAANSYLFQIILPDDNSKGSIFLYDTSSTDGPLYKSWQFAGQHPGRLYDGEDYGVVFSSQEAGLYDYRTNTLLAKYVFGFTPDPAYYDRETRAVSFSIKKESLPTSIEQSVIDYIIE